MIINSIELKNFRQFYGVQKIVLSKDPDKNITLIHAENGVGKTALLNSILWCLFNITTDNFQRKKELLNLRAKDLGENTVYVYIEFEEADKQFVAQRIISKVTGSQFRIFQIGQDGVHKEVDNPDIFINSIIPKDMAGYFFFQGEGVGSLAAGSGKDVQQAIRDILGFTIAEHALQDIAKVKTEYRREIQRIDNSTELSQVEEGLADCEEGLAELNSQLEETNKDRKYLAMKLSGIEQKLRESDVEVISAKQKSRDEKKSELDRLSQLHKSALARKVQLISKFGISSFGGRLADLGIDFIDEKEIKGTIPAPYNVQLVNDILSSAKCICGAEVKHGTEAFSRIQALLAKAGDPVLLNRVRRARSQLTVIRKDLKSARDEFSSVVNDIARIEESISKIKGELSSLSLEIQNVPIEEIKDKERERNAIFLQLQESNKRFGSLTERKEKLVDKQNEFMNREKSLRSSKPEILRLRKLTEFISAIEEELSKLLSSAEESSLKILHQKINRFLSLYVKQDFQARITQDYEIILEDRDSRPVGHSDGQGLLLSLTFISSLISLAKERKAASGNILTPGAVAPFIIDAPFGVLDNTYKANIADEIPKAVSQVVFLLSSSHWEGTVEQAIRPRVGVEYNLVLEVAVNQGPKEKSDIEILGSKYESVRYGCDLDMTRIEEVGCYV